MKTLIKNGGIVTLVHTYRADILIEDETISVIGGTYSSGDFSTETHVPAQVGSWSTSEVGCDIHTKARFGLKTLIIKPIQLLLFITLITIAALSITGQRREMKSVSGLAGWRFPVKSDFKGYWKLETWEKECKQFELANKKRINDAAEDFGTYQSNADPKSNDEKMECWKPDFPVDTATGDYDGDGIQDEARILISTNKSNSIGIFVFLGSKNEKAKIIKVETIGTSVDSPIQDHFISTVKPSDEKIPTACGKGYWDCGPSEPKAITLRRDAISFGEFEAWDSIAYWDSSSNKFKVVALSD